MSGGAREAAAAWTRWHHEAGDTERWALSTIVETSCPYACQPFALIDRDGRRWLLAMLDPPPSTDVEALLDWTPGDVAAIDTATGRTVLAGDTGAWLLGDIPGEVVHVYTCGLKWARAWAAVRAEALATFRRGRVPGLLYRDPPAQGLPGLLVAGRADRVADWAALRSRQRVSFDNTEVAEVARRWLVRSAGVPGIAARRDRLRVAA